jgi:hypothetical protein
MWLSASSPLTETIISKSICFKARGFSKRFFRKKEFVNGKQVHKASTCCLKARALCTRPKMFFFLCHKSKHWKQKANDYLWLCFSPKRICIVFCHTEIFSTRISCKRGYNLFANFPVFQRAPQIIFASGVDVCFNIFLRFLPIFWEKMAF